MLGAACLSVKLVPFRRLARSLGVYMMETLRTDLSPEQEAVARRICWSIALAARHVPWEAVCFPQSIAAKAMLARRGIPATLYFGVRKSTMNMNLGFDAHSWVRAGMLDVTWPGKPEEYRVVAVFG